jgi:hypothetical protein
LNCVGEENQHPVFAFFHPTFQEYFAACSIDDWDYFLPRGHVDRPVPCLDENEPTYRVFESEWRQPIVLWFGRGDVANDEKEKFIEKLTTFQDGVSNFYYYRAYCMGAIGVGEFRSSRQAEAIVREIVKWSFGYFNIESQKWIRSSPAISFIALEIISFTHCEYRENYINDILESSELDNEYRIEVAEALGGIDVGNKKAISVLVFLLKMETELSDYQRLRAAESLGRIDVGNKEAIIYLAALLKELNEFESGYGLEPEIFTFAVARALSKIDVGNEEAFSTLLSFLRSPDIGWLLFDVVDTLSEIGVESTEVIATLLSLLKNPDLDDSLRLCVVDTLSEIAVGNNDVITDLLSLLKNPDLDDSLRLCVVDTLSEIAVGNNDVITDLLSLLKNPDLDDLLRFDVANALSEIAIGNNDVITDLIVLQENHDFDNFGKFISAKALGKLTTGNKIAIDTLMALLEDGPLRFAIAEVLGEIDVGNEKSIAALTALLKEPILNIIERAVVAISLSKIDIGNEFAIASLATFSQDPNIRNSARVDIINALCKIDIEFAVAFLQDPNNSSFFCRLDLHEILTSETMPSFILNWRNVNDESEFYSYDLFLDIFFACAHTLSYLVFHTAWNSPFLTHFQNTPIFLDIENRSHTIHLNITDLNFYNSPSEITLELNIRIHQQLAITPIPETSTIPQLKRHLLNHQLSPHLVLILENPHPTDALITEITKLHTPKHIQILWLTDAPNIPNAFPPNQPNLASAIQEAIDRFTET